MQFLYQHPSYCRRMTLISSGGLGPDLGWILRLLAAPGADVLLSMATPPAVLDVGNAVNSLLARVGLGTPRTDELWNTYASLTDRQTRQAFVRTLRSVVDYRGQAVNGLNRLELSPEVPMQLIWGQDDRIIPLDHAHAAVAVRAGTRLKELDNVGHFPHIERPVAVIDTLDEFIAADCRVLTPMVTTMC